MVTTNIYTVIADNEQNVLMTMMGLEPVAFSVDSVDKVLNENLNEADFLFNINSKGGSVSEGLKIYDKLRTSGKNIHTNIEGSCHSMAMTVLLAAPVENRTANKNARALIHQVHAEPDGPQTSNSLRVLADQIELEQNNILDIYASRTGQDREILQSLMLEEKQRTAEELLQYGFISKINAYTTNEKLDTMSKATKKSLFDKIFNFQKEVTALLNEEPAPVNFDFKDAAGNVLFTTNKEDDSIAVGDTATPDGTFELPTGQKVSIENGLISTIAEPTDEGATETVETLKTENEALRAKLTDAATLITELSNEIKSDFVPPVRTSILGAVRGGSKTLSVEELINEAREKRDKSKGRTK